MFCKLGCSSPAEQKIEPKSLVNESSQAKIKHETVKIKDHSSAGPVVLDIREPEILKMLETHPTLNLSFGSILRHAIKEQAINSEKKLVNNSVLNKNNPLYQRLAEQLEADLKPFDQYLGVPTVKVNKEAKKFPAGNVGRQFDERWLKSPWGYFLLTGIINRYDRQDFSRPKNCGEVRFIYRLAYKKQNEKNKYYASRLPFFLSFVFEYPYQENCAEYLYTWQTTIPQDWPDIIGDQLSHAADFKKLRFQKLEINAQVVRFPAGLMRETAGQALYLLKQYQIKKLDSAYQYVSLALENTPDVRKLQSDSALKSELIQYIRDNIEDIDQGVYRLPDKFLAKEAISYSTMGNMRLANKPFDAIFLKRDLQKFSDLDFKKMAFIQSPQGLMERLNNATCMGCHQGNSTAGFQFLGKDRADFTGVTNQVQLEVSPHYQADLQRRMKYFQDVVSGRKPLKMRPLSYAPLKSYVSSKKEPKEKALQYEAAGINDFCLVDGGQDFHKEHRWSCESPEMECRELVKNENLHVKIGQCVYKKEEKKKIFSGLSCREGDYQDNASLLSPQEKDKNLPFNFFSFNESFSSKQFYDLPENKSFTQNSFNCRPTAIGVPLGRTFRNCTASERQLANIRLGEAIPDEICAIVGGAAFDRCAEGNFHDCFEQIVVRGVLDTCSEERFCREDYICQKLPLEMIKKAEISQDYLDDKKIGFCTPTYFLYQMRLDGHIVP